MIRGSEIAGAAGAWVLGLSRLAAAQCAMCGTALPGSDDPLARGIWWSVVFLISLPYAIVGSFVIGLVWAARRQRQRRERLRTLGGGLALEAGRKEVLR